MKAQEVGRCAVCGKVLRHGRYGRRPQYCGNACRQFAYRTRVDGLGRAQNDVAYVQYGVTK